MTNQDELKQFRFTPFMLAVSLYSVLFLWIIMWFEVKFGYNLNKYGVAPRTLRGLRGILFSPFIHSGVKHLFNNSIPLFLFLLALFYFYKKVAFKVLILGGLLTGLLTWIIGRESYHIGASGIIYMLFSFIFFSGIIKKYNRLIAVSLIVIFLYGSMVWYILPVEEGISWEGHLSGFLTGILFAIIYRKQGFNKPKFKFSKSEFDDMFDEDGNYIPPKPPEEVLEVIYHYNEDDKLEEE